MRRSDRVDRTKVKEGERKLSPSFVNSATAFGLSEGYLLHTPKDTRMNRKIRDEIIKGAWEPRLYTPQDLVERLEVQLPDACRIVFCASGGERRLAHHDLIQWLADLVSIVREPTLEELPPQARWLMTKGWRIDGTRKIFRYIHPRVNNCHMSLRGALGMQLQMDNQHPSDREDDEQLNLTEEDIIDVEFTVVSVSR
jgi:hypothetical protein